VSGSQDQLSQERACWCGHPGLEAYSDDYRVCRACGTLVSRAPLPPEAFTVTKDQGELYSRDYWNQRQTDHHGLPDIHRRARLDLPERCTHWLQHLLPLRPPPARVLEVGCAHGGYVALLGWAGYEATGTELSPWVADFGRETFGVNVLAGTVEALPLPEAGFDVVILNDVIEHLPHPVVTLTRCAQLLAPDGFFVIQTPEYREHLSYANLEETKDLFLRHMDRNNDEHLYLYSRRSAAEFFGRLGFPHLKFSEPVYAYDMAFTASRTPLTATEPAAVTEALARRPLGRLVQALLDKAYESTDRAWAIRRLETQPGTMRPPPQPPS
jgi:2-polyprenyl-3-methyl-5-hydroxy-6-metoxy-1,4-benzoquinol methylase